MSKHPGIIGHHQETPRDSSNHSLGHQCSLSGSIGLWLSYHKLPICLPQVTHICRTTEGKLGITRKHLGISSNHALGHQCSFSGPIGLRLKYPYFNHSHPHMSEHPGIIRHQQENPEKKTRDSSNHALGHQCSLRGSLVFG